VIVLSARVGSITDNHLGGWISYRTAKAALNQILRTSALEIKRTHPNACLLAVHPGTVDTEMTKNTPLIKGFHLKKQQMILLI